MQYDLQLGGGSDCCRPGAETKNSDQINECFHSEVTLVPGRNISSRRSHIVKCRRNASARITKIRGGGRQVHTYITVGGRVYLGSFAPSTICTLTTGPTTYSWNFGCSPLKISAGHIMDNLESETPQDCVI